MLATAPNLPSPVMSLPPVEYGLGPLNSGFTGQRQFKKHKVLPRPQTDRSLDIPRRRPADQRLALDTSLAGQPVPQVSNSRGLKHQSKRLSNGPELPPTPPIQSRNSSGSHSAQLPSPLHGDSKPEVTKTSSERLVVTPPDQRSPPTPDVTPPQPANRPRAVRPSLVDRGVSRTTTGDSRTESFKTAREEPFSSGEEDSRSTIRGGLASGRTSQATVRRVSDTKQQRVPQPQALDLALSELKVSPEGTYTPKSKGDFGQFDGDWGTPSEVEQEWDDNLQRTVTVRKTSPDIKGTATSRNEPIVVEKNIVKPSNATKALRTLPLANSPGKNGSVNDRHVASSSKRRATSSAPSNSDSSISRVSQPPRDLGATSSGSTVVGAILVDSSPQRRRTLRHVRKQRELRDSVDLSSDSTLDSILTQPFSRPPLQVLGNSERQRESFASTATSNSISSGRARREIWKSGAIPVVVVPDRRSSSKSKSKEPSLRSTSSRRSKRTMSVGSAPRGDSLDRESGNVTSGPVFERQSRRSRRFSESDRDERTLDFPPVIPARSSSLSAPTSRNNSRAGSMTMESVKARNALPRQPVNAPPEVHLTSSSSDKLHVDEPDTQVTPKIPAADLLHPSGSHHDMLAADVSLLQRQTSHEKPSLDHMDDAVSTKKYSSRNTPFSAASIETNGTAPEVSEAFAVHMYPHQNSSVLMVDHSARPSEASDTTLKKKQGSLRETLGRPRITTIDADGNGPVTPPQLQFSLDDIDSPLRNPRSPPQPPSGPPAINFIPATPSGLTPADDRMALMGNYFESMKEKPARRPSIVKRALNRHRRHSLEYPPTTSKAPSLLTRTFSLSRNVRKVFEPAFRGREKPDFEDDDYLPPEERPVEENKLHPQWRPQSLGRDFEDFDSGYGYEDEDDVVYRYPPIDNRPNLPKRSLSERMKRTFAIFPVHDESYPVETPHGPERRTIRRTPSGNLRVVQRKASADSLMRRRSLFGGQSNGPEGIISKAFWQGHSARRRVSKERYRRFSIAGTFEEIQSIPRRMSESRREKRSQALREKISGPKEVRDGVEDILRSNTGRHQSHYDDQI
ncbi:hypothetical protein HJFPF1_03818 [Paramyrothecium foliicola]|nr:hypothetical protein HJFPF1_03818 [Paramyrothecium foliicola]